MIITAMYIYGIIQEKWKFDIITLIIAFLGDLTLVSAFGR